MGLFGFGKKKVDKGAWSEAIWGKRLKHPEKETTEALSAYTTGMLVQYQRIIMESVNIIQTTRNDDTRQGRIELCRKNLGKMKQLEPFCDDEQKVMIMQAEEAMRSAGI